MRHCTGLFHVPGGTGRRCPLWVKGGGTTMSAAWPEQFPNSRLEDHHTGLGARAVVRQPGLAGALFERLDQRLLPLERRRVSDRRKVPSLMRTFSMLEKSRRQYGSRLGRNTLTGAARGLITGKDRTLDRMPARSRHAAAASGIWLSAGGAKSDTVFVTAHSSKPRSTIAASSISARMAWPAATESWFLRPPAIVDADDWPRHSCRNHTADENTG
jgi:hypothetical protein